MEWIKTVSFPTWTQEILDNHFSHFSLDIYFVSFRSGEKSIQMQVTNRMANEAAEKAIADEAIKKKNAGNMYRNWLIKKRNETKCPNEDPNSSCTNKNVNKSFLKIKKAHTLWLSKKNTEKRTIEKCAAVERRLCEIGEDIRRQLNEQRYKQWLGGTETRPKPVPFGRGLESSESKFFFFSFV